MNLETKITIYKFTPQVFTLTQDLFVLRVLSGNDTNAEKSELKSPDSHIFCVTYQLNRVC